MIEQVEIQQGNRTVTAYHLTLFAFTTEKGTFTLSGSNLDGIDEWREVGTANFHKWSRRQVYDWFMQGKIKPVDEAKSIDWCSNTTLTKNAVKSTKNNRHTKSLVFNK